MTPRPPVRTYRLGSKPPKKKKPLKPHMRVPQVGAVLLFVVFIVCVSAVAYRVRQEMQTSALQAEVFTELAKQIRFKMGEGQNPDFYAPLVGPYNQRLGYSYMPFFTKALNAESFAITAQMRASKRYHQLIAEGSYPIFHAKTVAGFSLADRSNTPLYTAQYPSHIFPNFNSLPPLLVQTLLFIENRELLKNGSVTRNPVIEWDRFFFAVLGRGIQNIAPGFNAGGGSTLATQIEKFRYSPGGRTIDAKDKIRQIISASLRVYLNGSDTREMRKHIVLDYLNSTPLSARANFGEINSIGDGLWAWFGRDLNEATIALNLTENDSDSLRAKALVYREVLSLILAQRRPTYYLSTNRDALENLTNITLDHLWNAGIISEQLKDVTKMTRLRILPEAPVSQMQAFLDQKATTALRSHLLSMLGIKNLYELDRIDLSAVSTLDQPTQQKVVDFLKKMGEKDFVKSIGLFGFRLLKEENDPSKIKWSVVLYESGKNGNRLRIQADNVDGPFDMNEGVKLDLGSTAKLRTLVTYLEIVAELYRRHSGLSTEDLFDLAEEAPDALTEWAARWLHTNPDASLSQILEAAMDRKYSANPGEVFFTGGGAHVFANFEKEEDHRIMDVREALRDSVNLVFVRMMRDIVNYTISQGAQTKQELISDPDNPARRDYLERYADKEGTTFLNRYINDYQNLSPDEALDKATRRAHKGATARTVLFRSLRPLASYAEYMAYMDRHMSDAFDRGRLPKLYRDYPVTRYSLADRGYISGLNPLELWLISYIQANPGSQRSAILAVSRPIRIDSYTWLFSQRRKGAQDTRIRILLEQDAFARIHKRWARLGYPFERLIPSYATSIGSSADRPGALAELAGILLNKGIKNPTIRFEKLHFAANTPYETVFEPSGIEGPLVLDPAITEVVRKGMTDVITNGTAKRLNGVYLDTKGKPLAIGGKTGTGDHRYDEYAAGGRLISSRVVNRTGTLVFFIGDKWFGTVTAHVAGEEAGNYKFTSALSAQMLKSLSPILLPLINGTQQTQTQTPAPTQP